MQTQRRMRRRVYVSEHAEHAALIVAVVIVVEAR